MILTSTTVKRPVGTIMFFIAIILLGVISLSNLSINLLPDLNYPKITILTDYPGSGPEEIEKFITTELEGPLSSISGIKKVTSVSKEGISVITLEFHWGTDMDFALLHTKEKVEEVRRNLPDDCEDPEILEMDPSASPIIIATLKSEKRDLRNLKETAEFIIKQRLEQIEGIARVEIRGGYDQEISVEVNPEIMKNMGITLAEVAAAIENNNIFQSGGTVKKDKYKYTLKVEGEIQEPVEILQIVVKKLEDRDVLIKDIGGRAFFKNKIKQGDIRFNESQSIALLIYKESQGNTKKATVEAEKTLEALSSEFKDLIFFVISREADLIISSISSLTNSLLIGAFLAFLILLLFLQNFKYPIFGALSIVLSIAATFVLMFIVKVNVNIMSLGGLVLGVGMFVDNSIIVIESIFRHKGKNKLTSSVVSGTKEVGGAITASTFTTISIFLPVIYLHGITGKLFRDQALTVSFSLISSLFVAITLLPTLSAITFKKVFRTDFGETLESPRQKKWFHSPLKGINTVILIPIQIAGYIIYYIFGGIFFLIASFFRYLIRFLNFLLNPVYRAFNRTYQKFNDYYHDILEKILDKKRIAVWLSVIILVLIYFSFSILKKELLPSPDSAKFEIKAQTPPVYGFEETDAFSSKIEKRLMEIDGIEYVFAESGFDPKTVSTEDISVNNIHFYIKCKSPDLRPKFMEIARDVLNEEKDKKNLLNFTVFLEKNSLSQYLATSGENFKVKVFYENIERGKEAVNLIIDKIKDFKDLHDLKANTSEGKPLFAIRFKEGLLKKLNISKDVIANNVHQAVRGKKAGVLKKTLKNYDIFVRVPITGIMEANHLLSLPVSINNNTYYIRDLIDFEEMPSIKEISRESQERYFLISGDVKGKRLDSIIRKAEISLQDVEMPMNTRYMFAGEEEERKKAFDSLNQAILLAVILVYMVMAAKFENIVQPFIIMLTVPMGIIGAFLFLLISGNTLNIISGIGIMVLIGIGVNDAIVKIEYSNQLRREGMSVREAVLQASRVRLRPILMTTFTTIFALIPMALARQTGSELQRPLALVVIGGLFCTTLLTLILIPVSYEVVENIKEKRKARKEGLKPKGD